MSEAVGTISTDRKQASIQRRKNRMRAYNREYAVKNRDKLNRLRRERNAKNREKQREVHRIWREANRPKISGYLDKNREASRLRRRATYVKHPKVRVFDYAAKLRYIKKWRSENRERLVSQAIIRKEKVLNDPVLLSALRNKRNEVRRLLMENNPCERIAALLRSRVSSALKRCGGIKCKKTVELIGCSVAFLRKHLESQFCHGMNWSNCGRNGWHIDHIRPCSSFDLTSQDEQIRCFHYLNLQPLWEADNLRKGAKIPLTPDMACVTGAA